ncbi:MAG: bifunctional tetrahydrofolate synthase/dihydrofolate synthase [Sulfuriferula sp.]|nr:bifunctional tetrahydrofolate synthase/dihydrofolate synthase [Sulfuriferula sp.]
MDLNAWLQYLEGLHPKAIDLGLERVAQVRNVLLPDLRIHVITVGGTNGKGSTCAYLEAMLSAAGYRVGLYTSPHLLRYNERVRIAQHEVDDARLCAAFAAIEAARGQITLSYFEFGTLAAMWLFAQAAVDIAILEVGLGGRLDAVNIFDADSAVITSIDIDHTEYLGTTRDQIAREKAGIFRARRPVICGEAYPPAILHAEALRLHADWRAIGDQYRYQPHAEGWDYRGTHTHLNLPLPLMRGDYQLANAATAIAALESVETAFPVTEWAIRQGLLSAQVPGRYQIAGQNPQRILDVAHNPHGANALAHSLAQSPVSGKTYAVFGMLADKDIAGVVAAMRDVVDVWLVAGLDVPRGATAGILHETLTAAGIADVSSMENIAAAWIFACEHAQENDRICVFGSFYTVAAILRLIAG